MLYNCEPLLCLVWFGGSVFLISHCPAKSKRRNLTGKQTHTYEFSEYMCLCFTGEDELISERKIKAASFMDHIPYLDQLKTNIVSSNLHGAEETGEPVSYPTVFRARVNTANSHLQFNGRQ